MDIGIDLGTANIMISMENKGVVSMSLLWWLLIKKPAR